MPSALPIPTRSYDFQGSTPAVADQVDVELNALFAVLQGGIGNVHIADDASIAFSKLAATAYTAYTPTWKSTGTLPAIGNGILRGYYCQIGKTVHFFIAMVAGTTTTFGTGSWGFGFPPALAPISADPTEHFLQAVVTSLDSSANTQFPGQANVQTIASTVVVQPFWGAVAANIVHNAAFDLSNPYAWASADWIVINGTFEAA